MDICVDNANRAIFNAANAASIICNSQENLALRANATGVRLELKTVTVFINHDGDMDVKYKDGAGATDAAKEFLEAVQGHLGVYQEARDFWRIAKEHGG